MSSIQWVLFDLGGVLVEIDPGRIFHQLAGYVEQSADAVHDAVAGDRAFWQRMITAEMTPAEVTAHVNAALGARLSEHQVVQAINSELGNQITTTAELIPRLKRRVRVGCLSNTNSLHWDELLRAYSFMHDFDRRFASQLLGSAKPSTIIYERVVQVLDAAPTQLLFFDDRQDNVDAATALGWNARLYTGHSQLLQDLAEFRLL